jgi:hypothetical protein
LSAVVAERSQSALDAESDADESSSGLDRHPEHVLGAGHVLATDRSDRGEDSSVSPKARRCVPFQVEFCRQLPYNFTTFPNALGHASVDEAKHDIEKFKQVTVRSNAHGMSLVTAPFLFL